MECFGSLHVERWNQLIVSGHVPQRPNNRPGWQTRRAIWMGLRPHSAYNLLNQYDGSEYQPSRCYQAEIHLTGMSEGYIETSYCLHRFMLTALILFN